MLFQVYYMRPDFFSRFILGSAWPVVAELDKTHAHLCEIEADSLEQVFARMQGENWSPNGEARPLLEDKGLHHTSMSVGDVVRDPEGHYHCVAPVGFHEISASV